MNYQLSLKMTISKNLRALLQKYVTHIIQVLTNFSML